MFNRPKNKICWVQLLEKLCYNGNGTLIDYNCKESNKQIMQNKELLNWAKSSGKYSLKKKYVTYL